ncbi:MAG: adenylate kinase [archaeon]
MNLIFFGAPNAGKGTYAQGIKNDFMITQVSSGDMLREEVKTSSVLGKKIKELIDAGKFVDDQTMIELFKQRLTEKDCEKGFILDGFPRTLPQAQALDEMLESLNKKIDLVLSFEVPIETLIDRVTGRRTCPKCNRIFHVRNVPPKVEGKCDDCGIDLIKRVDDNEETLRKRVKEFQEKTAPLIEYYDRKKLLLKVDGDRLPEIVLKELKEMLKERFG